MVIRRGHDADLIGRDVFIQVLQVSLGQVLATVDATVVANELLPGHLLGHSLVMSILHGHVTPHSKPCGPHGDMINGFMLVCNAYRMQHET